MRPVGEGMTRGQDHDLLFGVQILGVESGCHVVRPVEQSNIGTPVAQQTFRLARPAQHHLDRHGARFGGVGVQQLRQQFAGRSGFGGQHHAGLVGRGAAGSTLGGFDRLERGPGLAQQHRSGLGQGDGASGAVQQDDSESPFELLDGSRQWWLRDREPFRRPPEVQLLGDGDEVSHLPRLHQGMVSGDDNHQYPCGIAAHPIGLGRRTRSRSRIGGVSEQTIALVTGANKGIGYEIAAGLGALGWRIGVGARDRQRRDTAVEKLRAAGTDAFGVPLDVTDDASVAAAADLIADQAGGLDVLVNNAAITGDLPQTPTTVDPATVRIVVDTNVIGVIRVTNAMLPMLRASASPRIVNMSSSVGSLTLQTTPGIDMGPVPAAYSASKTFLNALTLQYVKELSDTKILINSGCPGFTATDLNGFRGVRTPQQGAAIAIHLATLPDDGPTGGFFDDAGTVPW